MKLALKKSMSKGIMGLYLISMLLLTACGKKQMEKNPQASAKPEEKVEAVENKPVKLPGPYDALIPQWSKMEGIKSSCEGTTSNLAVPVNIIAANISKDSLAYGVEPYSDCSGIFLRVLDSLEIRCPKHKFPNPKKVRDSRALARWYHEQGQLIQVKDPLEMDKYIKPGVVMFYGGRGAAQEEVDLEVLFDHGGINHVGVVTSVKKDEEGTLIGYALFHGQRPGKLASITNYHKRSYRNRPQYPPYGNGTEPWVAVAPIVDTDDPLF